MTVYALSENFSVREGNINTVFIFGLMERRYKQQIYVLKAPAEPKKGCSWIELFVDDIKRLSIPTTLPSAYENRHRNFGLPNLPARGRAGTKRFTLLLNGESIQLRTHKALTIAAACAWLNTWAPADAQLVTSSGRTYQIAGTKVGNQAHFIYFIFNADSDAIKIGRAKNVSKRLKALQTSSPALLGLLKTIPVEGLEAAQMLERSLHQQFQSLRLNGEWFKAAAQLRQYIEDL